MVDNVFHQSVKFIRYGTHSAKSENCDETAFMAWWKCRNRGNTVVNKSKTTLFDKVHSIPQFWLQRLSCCSEQLVAGEQEVRVPCCIRSVDHRHRGAVLWSVKARVSPGCQPELAHAACWLALESLPQPPIAHGSVMLSNKRPTFGWITGGKSVNQLEELWPVALAELVENTLFVKICNPLFVLLIC